MAEQVPSIGRVVHFMYGIEHFAAIITHPLVNADEVALTVFPPNDAPFITNARYDAGCAPATWHWPEFVPAKES